MLFRRKGIASTILAIALLIALLASVNALVNNINTQTQKIADLAQTGKTYIITSQNYTSLIESQVSQNTANKIRTIAGIQNIITQKIFQANLTTISGTYPITIRAVDNATTYFTTKQTRTTGTYCTNPTQANIGTILANIAKTKNNETVTLSTGTKSMQTQIVGTTKSSTQSDTEITILLKTAETLTGETQTASFIEFSLKNPTDTQPLTQVKKSLPTNEKIVEIQQITTFAQDTTSQFVTFLKIWSVIIYAVVIAASYIIATRLITEAKFELAMYRTIGAKRNLTIQIVLIYTVATALVGTILGLAIGIAGAQIASTAIRWTWGNLQLTPNLNPEQALQITVLSLTSATIGCLSPALKSANNNPVEDNP
jgi:ABC-type lipoprotein release transport system permease subunit